MVIETLVGIAIVKALDSMRVKASVERTCQELERVARRDGHSRESIERAKEDARSGRW